MCNGKPTVIDFYADWCESCKAMAPSMRSIESQYKDKVNFVTLDGSNTKNGKRCLIVRETFHIVEYCICHYHSMNSWK